MAAIPVTISGMIFDTASAGVTGRSVTLVGDLSLTGLSVGGGPVFPSTPPGTPTFPIWGPPGFNPPGPGYPPGISGGPIIPPGPPPLPTFPIWGPPGISLPPGSGYPPVAGHPLPEPPPGGSKPEPVLGWEAKTFWTPETGWAVAIVPKPDTPVPTPSS